MCAFARGNMFLLAYPTVEKAFVVKLLYKSPLHNANVEHAQTTPDMKAFLHKSTIICLSA